MERQQDVNWDILLLSICHSMAAATTIIIVAVVVIVIAIIRFKDFNAKLMAVVVVAATVAAGLIDA